MNRLEQKVTIVLTRRQLERLQITVEQAMHDLDESTPERAQQARELAGIVLATLSAEPVP